MFRIKNDVRLKIYEKVVQQTHLKNAAIVRMYTVVQYESLTFELNNSARNPFKVLNLNIMAGYAISK